MVTFLIVLTVIWVWGVFIAAYLVNRGRGLYKTPFTLADGLYVMVWPFILLLIVLSRKELMEEAEQEYKNLKRQENSK